MKKQRIYLASPYSHPDPAIREERWHAACRASAALMKAGRIVFSPIAQTHPMALLGDLPLDFEFWQDYNRAWIEACSRLIVLTLDGWRESVGVRGEIAIAKELGIEIEYLGPNIPGK